jgi:hypothetical protein
MHPHGAALAFTPRSCGFDWRQLHGTDLEEVVRRSDVAALEALLPMLQQGRLDREAGACVSNCMQLVSGVGAGGGRRPPRPRPLSCRVRSWRGQLTGACLRPVQAQACQLAVEYLAHLKGAHLCLIARHQQAVQRASRWAGKLQGGRARGRQQQQQLARQPGLTPTPRPCPARSWKEAARAYIAAVHEAQQEQAQLAQQHGRARPCRVHFKPMAAGWTE